MQRLYPCSVFRSKKSRISFDVSIMTFLPFCHANVAHYWGQLSLTAATQNAHHSMISFQPFPLPFSIILCRVAFGLKSIVEPPLSSLSHMNKVRSGFTKVWLLLVGVWNFCDQLCFVSWVGWVISPLSNPKIWRTSDLWPRSPLA